MRQTAAARSSRIQAANAFGEWLDQMQYNEGGELVKPWDYWTTWTFEIERTGRSARRAIEAHLERIGVSRAFWGTETGDIGGRLHGHGLLQFDRQIPPQAEAIWRDWFQRHGRAHVDEFDQDQGATHYVSEYVSKEMTDYDLMGVGRASVRKGIFSNTDQP